MYEKRPCPQSLAEARLTSRELQILKLIVAGKLNKEIAAELGISKKTVETHISHIYYKLCVQNRAEAIVWAMQHALA